MKSLAKPVGPLPGDIHKKLMKKWDKGDFYRCHKDQFPYTVSLGTIPASTLSNRYEDVRQWILAYQKMENPEDGKPFCCIQWKETNHRQLGKNDLPGAILFDKQENLARFLGRWKEWQTFQRLRGVLAQADLRLANWAEGAPFELLACSEDLERLLSLWRWIIANREPQIFLRQIDIPGIDTKFTESYKKLLTQWLNLTLSAERISELPEGTRHFEERYGFRKKPELIRFRFLDPDLSWGDGQFSDISLPSHDFCRLYQNDSICPAKYVFVVENDINALAFPLVKQGMVIFGRGYHFENWRDAQWLHQIPLWYWGDLDTHGFRILDQFRSYFPHSYSFLMDRKTLLAHIASWGGETRPTETDLTHLTPEENLLYDDLRFNRIEKNLRLEQEFISYGYLEKALKKIVLSKEIAPYPEPFKDE